MKKINLAVTGCLGRMGQQIIKSSKNAQNFKLVSITENRIINRKISGLKPQLNSEEAFKNANIIIDFTIPKCTLEVLKIASKLRKKVVIGTTGFTQNQEKIIRLAELSLMDFLTRSKDDVLRYFGQTPQHWMMLHKVLIAYYKNETISKNQLLKFMERSYLTSNTYIDNAIKKDYFKIIRNKKDKRSIFILPTEVTLKSFEKFVMKRENLYKI